MSIKYKVVKQATPGITGGGEYRYYARLTGRQNIGLNDLCDHIARISTLSHADIYAVVVALLSSIPDFLKDGYNISLGDLGTFSLSLTSAGMPAPEKVTSRQISKVNIRFRPRPRFKKSVMDAEFEKVK